MILLLLFSLAKADIILDREMKANTADPKVLDVTLNITPQGVEKYDVAELYPIGWLLTDWQVSGNTTSVSFEQQSSTYKDKLVALLHWNFSDKSYVILKYSVKSPQTTSGNEQLTSIVIYPGGFSTNNYLLTLGEGGIIKQSISVQPIISFQGVSSAIVAIILVVLMTVLVYYVWKLKKSEGVEIRQAVMPQKPVQEFRQMEMPRQITPPPKPPKLIVPQKPIAQPIVKLAAIQPKPKPIAPLFAPRPVLTKPQPTAKPQPLPSFQQALGKPPVPPFKQKEKAKSTKIKPKSAKFYKNTIKRLEKIEKSLKKEK